MNRILLEPADVGADGLAVLKDRQAEHVLQVLKSRPGDDVRIGVIDGLRGVGRVTGYAPGEVQLSCTLDTPPLPSTQTTLLLALPRPKVLHRLWAPLASMGLDRIILTAAAKVERQYFDTHWLQPEAYRPLLVEGLEQSGDTRLPAVTLKRRFKPFIEDEADMEFEGTTRLVCHPYAENPLVSLLPAQGEPVVIAIGPEGGWTDFEIGLLQAHGFACGSFGERTLRTDTAVQAILGAVLARMPIRSAIP